MTVSNWRGKTAIVCGASAGLGLSLSRALCEGQLSQLRLIARNEHNLQELQRQLGAQFPETEVLAHAVDVCDPGCLGKLSGQIADQERPVDAVFNAVGQSDRGTLLQLSSERLLELFQVNVVSNLNVLKACTPLLRSPGGTFVVIGSLASLFAPRYLGGYALVKHSLAAFAQQARLELASQGIHVMLVCPGPIARADAGTRYQQLADGQASTSDSHSSSTSPQPTSSGESTPAAVPASALQPGGGARIKGLDSMALAHDILHHAQRRKKRLLVRPRKAWYLHALGTLMPSLGEFILRRKTS